MHRLRLILKTARMFGFGRKKKQDPTHGTACVQPTKARLGDGHPVWDEPGPRDVSEVDTSFGYIDHGSVQIPIIEGIRVSPLGTPKEGKAAGIRIGMGTSLLEIEVFAAPRSGGVWTEMRHKLRELAPQMGATVESRAGRYGTEQKVTIPVDLPDGGKGLTVVREIGHEGPRWLARVKILGQAAIEAEEIRRSERLLDQIVIVRGSEPRTRLELLPVNFETENPYTVTAE